MFPVFRRTRKKLAADNQILKYLRYAIGEIVLVVIGILIALQVNNRNQSRLENQAEQQALVNLKQDFNFNKDKLLYLISESDSIINISIRVLNHTGNKYQSNTPLNMDSLLGPLVTTPKYYPKNGFLDDLIDSGNLGLIKNENLRMLLSSWNPSIGNIKEREGNSILLDNKTEEYIHEKGNWLKADRYTYADLGLPESGFQTNNTELLKDQKFENYIEAHVIYINMLKSGHREALELVDEILSSIDKEIKR
ncbi:MAG: hypothetical protein H6539_08905 [Bacteroidales bacterium]|nr:hypothetical protein [Bacteroidales bacterium]